jgi:hypothetical protein
MPASAQNPLPSLDIQGEATTEDCKALLGCLDPSLFGGAGPSGAWKRVSKRGSGLVVERSFAHASGLAALVLQTQGRLWVAALAKKIENLPPAAAFAPQAAAGAVEASTGPAPLEARAPAAESERVAKILATRSEENAFSEFAFYELMKAASETPEGSALRLAVGNLFKFEPPARDLPPSDWPGVSMFTIACLADGGPNPDMPHWLDLLTGGRVESPNESCDQWISLPPKEAMTFLLSLGIGPSQAAMDLDNMDAFDPAYCAPLISMLEARALDAGVPKARAAPRAKPL